jgi:hypothetical protein
MMPFRLPFVMLLVVPGAVACLQANSSEKLVSPANMSVRPLDWKRSRFTLGLPAEVAVFGGEFDSPIADIRTAVCADGSCLAERSAHGFSITPLKPTFHLHLEGENKATWTADPSLHAPFAIDRELQTTDKPFGGVHDGAGPGMPFLTGMTLTWGLGPADGAAAWPRELTEVTVTGPFELGPKPASAPGAFDLVPVAIHSTHAGEGTLTCKVLSVTRTYALKTFPIEEVRSLHVAPATANAFDEPVDLRAIATDRLELPVVPKDAYQPATSRFWVVFETASGDLGIAGGGDSTPDASALYELFTYVATPRSGEPATPMDALNAPSLGLSGHRPGDAKLTLRVGHVTSVVDVTVR